MVRFAPSRTLALLATVGLVAGCGRDLSTLPDASAPSIPGVYLSNFVSASFQAFGGSDLSALSIDPSTVRNGAPAIKIAVPGEGSYAGGAFVADAGRDLSAFNALTFYVKASKNATLNVAGLGNDNTGTSRFTAERGGIPLTTTWTKVVIPIPLAAKLTNERGLFYFAEGPEDGAGYTIWFSEIKFESVTNISNVRPAMATITADAEVNGTVSAAGTAVTVAVGGVDQTLAIAPGYFTFASSDPTIATVSAAGVATLIAPGSATITAKLGTIDVAGSVTIRTATGPATAAPVPTRAQADVVSLFSDSYTNATIDTWSAVWDQADVSDVTIAGNAAKKYSNLVFAGVEFTTTPVNATAMTSMHLDVFPQGADPLKIKLVDFGANGAFGGGDDTEHEVTVPITAGVWNSLDIPFANFAGLTGRSKLAQLIISGGAATMYFDNIYFFKVVVPTSPPTAAPTPTFAPGDVVSLFSNAYTNSAVNTWSADWDQADVADVAIAGNTTKHYTNLVFAGIEFTGTTVNATAMTHFVFDLWTPSPTNAPNVFKVKLVDFGANGVFGGGDEVEHELTFTSTTTPALATGQWVRFEIPLSAFTGLTTRGHLAQLIISGNLSTVFIDNVLFRK
jgi:hypothetical protein